jgi:acyl transferase domain-containing protein
VAFTLQTGRTGLDLRTYVAASTTEGAIAGLRVAMAKARAVEQRPRIAFLFPGQGAQYAGMGLGLDESSPAFRRAFRECLDPIREILGEDLRGVLKDSPEKLARTRYTQPALFAVMYALARHWESLGIRPEAAIGHSIGEFVAAALAGVIEPSDAARLVALRGKLVDACPPGGMMAIRMPAEELRPILPPSLEIAAYNAPASQVVAGLLPDLEAFEKALSDRGVSCRSLKTSHAFHSRMMDEMPWLSSFHYRQD